MTVLKDAPKILTRPHPIIKLLLIFQMGLNELFPYTQCLTGNSNLLDTSEHLGQQSKSSKGKNHLSP